MRAVLRRRSFWWTLRWIVSEYGVVTAWKWARQAVEAQRRAERSWAAYLAEKEERRDG